MKTSPLLILAALLLFTGCASKPVVYHAPGSAKMDASGERLHKAVVDAKATHQKVQTTVAAVKSGVKTEGEQIATLEPKLDELFRVAPPELRDKIDAARMEVTIIKDGNAILAKQVDSVVALQATEGAQLEEANAADKQHAADRDEYKAAAEVLAQKASTESIARVAAENKVHELESKNWIRRALESLAGIAILVGAFLWFTGKLTLSAASVAAKI